MHRGVSCRRAKWAAGLLPGLLGALSLAGCAASPAGPADAGPADGALPPNDGENAESGSVADDELATPTYDAMIGDASPAEATGVGATDDGRALKVVEAAPGACGNVLGGGATVTTTAHLDIGIHDPSMTWDGSRYFLFGTGGTLGIRSSADMEAWIGAGSVFRAIPGWIAASLGAAPADLWAPDISYFAGRFHLYYAASKFGSNNSLIGLATNTTLTPANPSYAWTDEGLVLRTVPSDNFNAIDPNVSFDETCAPWLAFGSFWSGIKLRKLDPSSGKPATDDTTLYSLASRNGGAIEAASIVSHDGYFYLFVSFDSCCQGVASTYRTMVGRSQRITGPYLDKAGADMMQGAAEQLLATSGRYVGPGGGTAWRDGDTYLYAFHYYDGQAGGASKLQVRPIQFGADGWVTLQAPLFP